MARAPLDIILTARDQATTVMDRVNDRFISSTRNMVLGVASLTTAIRLAGRASDLWGTITETAADRVSNSLVKVREGQLKVNDAWADMAKAIPFVGRSIAEMLKKFSAGTREMLDQLKEVEARIKAREVATAAGATDLAKRQAALRGAPPSALMRIDFAKERLAQDAQLAVSAKDLEFARKKRDDALKEASQLEKQFEEERARNAERNLEAARQGLPGVPLRGAGVLRRAQELRAQAEPEIEFFRRAEKQDRAVREKVRRTRTTREAEIRLVERQEARGLAQSERELQEELGRGRRQKLVQERKEAQEAALDALLLKAERAPEVLTVPETQTLGQKREARARFYRARRRAAGYPVRTIDEEPPWAREDIPRQPTVGDAADVARKRKGVPQTVRDPEVLSELRKLAPEIARQILSGFQASDISGK